MASVMAIESEVFGSCVGEIDVSVEIKNVVVWLCFGWNYLGFILEGKVSQDWRNRWEMVPGIGQRFGRFWCDWRNKKPLCWQGLGQGRVPKIT